MFPSQIIMVDVFFDWIQFNCDENPSFRMQEIFDNHDPREYINVLKKNLAHKNNKLFQVKRTKVDKIDLPYTFIDENYKFALFIPDYNNEKMIKLFMLDNGCSAEETKNFMYTIYVRLLPYRFGCNDEYRLVVIKKAIETGNYLGDLYLFRVFFIEKDGKIYFKFEDTKFEDERGKRQNLIDDYSSFDFDKNADSLTGNGSISSMVYDIDKQSADLFICNPFDSESMCLRFVWDGSKYVKKGLVKRDFEKNTKCDMKMQ